MVEWEKGKLLFTLSSFSVNSDRKAPKERRSGQNLRFSLRTPLPRDARRPPIKEGGRQQRVLCQPPPTLHPFGRVPRGSSRAASRRDVGQTRILYSGIFESTVLMANGLSLLPGKKQSNSTIRHQNCSSAFALPKWRLFNQIEHIQSACDEPRGAPPWGRVFGCGGSIHAIADRPLLRSARVRGGFSKGVSLPWAAILL